MQSPYDEIAGLYDRLWHDWYLPAALPAIEKLFFSKLLPNARMLDLCCGSGHVTEELVRRGYDVTGIDSSEQLVSLAKKRLPGVDLRLQDARDLTLESRYAAAISTFDSLNHILRVEDLREVFARVHGSLQPNGLFVFDMNLEEAYSADLRQWVVDVADRSVALVRGTYDIAVKRAATEVIWFVKTDNHLWEQHRTIVEQQCYPQSEILLAIADAGFQKIEAIPATKAGVTSELGVGRVFFTARA